MVNLKRVAIVTLDDAKQHRLGAKSSTAARISVNRSPALARFVIKTSKSKGNRSDTSLGKIGSVLALVTLMAGAHFGAQAMANSPKKPQITGALHDSQSDEEGQG